MTYTFENVTQSIKCYQFAKRAKKNGQINPKEFCTACKNSQSFHQSVYPSFCSIPIRPAQYFDFLTNLLQ